MTIDKAEATKQIWAKEQAIFEGRSKGDLSPYMSFTDRDYAAWPAGRSAPVDAEALARDAIILAPATREQLTLEFIDLRISGTAAVIYFRTHRSRMPDGEPVDQRYDNTHTWVHDGQDWRILGGLSRLLGPNEGFR